MPTEPSTPWWTWLSEAWHAGGTGGLNWHLEITSNFTNAGCDIDAFIKASERSPEELVQLISTRYFKGAMPAPLRLGAQNLLSKEMSSFTSMEKVTNLLQILLSTPTYGVVK